MNFHDELVRIGNEITRLETIELSDIPDIDLYMDQVTTFMESKLESYKRNNKDKILTKTMINNYAKAKLLPPPVKKKYNKNHIMVLIIIYHLKSILSINDIQILLEPITNEIIETSKNTLLEMAYKNFIKIQNHIQEAQIGEILTNQQIFDILDIDTSIKNYKVVENVLAVLVLAIYSNTEKRLAEKIIDLGFKQNFT